MPIFQKRHYEAIAAVIAGFDSTTRAHVATCFAGMLARDNPKFRREQFMRAAGCVPDVNRWQNPQTTPAAPATPRPFAVGDIVAPRFGSVAYQEIERWRISQGRPVWTAATRLRVRNVSPGNLLTIETAPGGPDWMGIADGNGEEYWRSSAFVHADLIPCGTEQDE